MVCASVPEFFSIAPISPVIMTETIETIIKADTAAKKNTKEKYHNFSGKKRTREMMEYPYSI